MVFTEKKVYIKGPANHQRSRVGGNNVMVLFLEGNTRTRSWKLKVEKNDEAR
jgi:hypothetical protein